MQILLRVSKWRMRTQTHTRVYLHMGKFTPGSDQMQILFLEIRQGRRCAGAALEMNSVDPLFVFLRFN